MMYTDVCVCVEFSVFAQVSKWSRLQRNSFISVVPNPCDFIILFCGILKKT